MLLWLQAGLGSGPKQLELLIVSQIPESVNALSPEH